MSVGTVAQPSMIELRRLHRYFGGTRAVHDVSFDVPAGTVFGYIGPNGAGKTTSMRILATLDLPTYGDALIDGFSVINDPDRVRRRLGFMPDYFGTYPNVNCYEYLDFFARAYGLIGRQRHQALRHTMSFTGLDRLAEKPIRGLSKGMKQRLCLGRAMIHDPSVLILDEPAAGLDPRARIELREMIRELAARGKTILISSHILTELAEMCDRVGIIEQGCLLATGTVQEIYKGATPHSEVQVRVLGGAEPLKQWLGQRGDVRELRVEGDLLRFSHDGSREEQADFLREIVLAGFRIAEFAAHEKSLEDVFMHVTRGVVQ
jgi:ABC-2 type transport system ATP-binding protein